MVFNATLNSISVIYRGGQFYWWRKPEYLEKTTDTDKLLSHDVISSTPCHDWEFELTTLVVIGTD
jgi:hypothetical protein